MNQISIVILHPIVGGNMGGVFCMQNKTAAPVL